MKLVVSGNRELVRLRLLPSFIHVAVACAVGCDSNAVPLEKGDSGVSGAAGASATESFWCELRPDPDFGIYGTCSANVLAHETQYLGDCIGSTTWFFDDEDVCGACFCRVPCVDDEDCPAPETGNATPMCQRGQTCMLPCGGGERCPDGMHCTELPDENGRFCVWLLSDANSLMCALEDDPLKDDADMCNRFTTPAECEARINGDSRQPRVACLWATVSMFDTGSDSCEPIHVEEKCVIAELRSPDGVPESAHCGNRSVHFKDLGPRTTTLTELKRCGYQPMDTTPCAFGNPPLPLFCDCACGDSLSLGASR